MRVYIRAFASLNRRIAPLLQKDREDVFRAGTTEALDIPDGSSIGDLLKCLQLGEKDAKMVFVNGRACRYDYALHQDDEVGIFPPIGGG
jgi:molybdopterin converting factor small subunit